MLEMRRGEWMRRVKYLTDALMLRALLAISFRRVLLSLRNRVSAADVMFCRGLKNKWKKFETWWARGGLWYPTFHYNTFPYHDILIVQRFGTTIMSHWFGMQRYVWASVHRSGISWRPKKLILIVCIPTCWIFSDNLLQCIMQIIPQKHFDVLFDISRSWGSKAHYLTKELF